MDTDAHDVLGEIIAEAAASGASVVFSEHRPAIAHVHADTAYRVADGGVALEGRVVTTGPVAEVVLADSGHARDTDWDAVDGVVGHMRRDNLIAVKVARDRSDSLLLLALRDGWSVEGVRR